MAQLRDDYKTFIDHQTEIIVFGPENETTFKNFWQKEKMPFPGIADPQHTVANQYGQEVKILKLGRMPALFVIDREGLIRFRHHGQSMSDIPVNEDVVSLLTKLNQDFKQSGENNES
jgi:peroxiredoxin